MNNRMCRLNSKKMLMWGLGLLVAGQVFSATAAVTGPLSSTVARTPTDNVAKSSTVSRIKWYGVYWYAETNSICHRAGSGVSFTLPGTGLTEVYGTMMAGLPGSAPSATAKNQLQMYVKYTDGTTSPIVYGSTGINFDTVTYPVVGSKTFVLLNGFFKAPTGKRIRTVYMISNNAVVDAVVNAQIGSSKPPQPQK